MRTEKRRIARRGDPVETSHVYSWDSPHKLDYVVEVDEMGCVMVRDLKGNAIHASHLLRLVEAERIVEHQMERERMQKVRDEIRAEKLSDTRNELLAEISTK